MTDETTPGGAATPAPTPTPAPPPYAPMPSSEPNGLAIASLVLGIVSLLLFWIPFIGWLPVILGVVLGLIAMQQPTGRGMAMAGLVCSGVALALKVMFWMAIFSFFGAWHLHHHYW
jgi:hypothetical protein